MHGRDRRGPAATRRASRSPTARRVALYVGLVTDTGRFQYANTTPRAHRLAARLLEEGVQPAHVFATLFESLPLARQRLLGLALGRAQVAGGGRLARDLADARRLRRRRAPTTPSPTASSTRCGRSRASSWPRSCASRATARGPAHKVSLRSRAGGLDCSAIARERGGGGHPGAAGFSTRRVGRGDRGLPERGGVGVNAGAVLLVDKPAGPTSFDCVARVRGALGGRKVKVGHAGTLDPFATGLLALLVGPRDAARALPRRASTSATARRCSSACAPTRAIPRARSSRATGRCPTPPRSRARLRRLRRARSRRCRPRPRRSRSTASAPTRSPAPAWTVEMPAREVQVHALDVVAYDAGDAAAPCSTSTARRAPTCARWRAISATPLGCGAYCAELRRTGDRPPRRSSAPASLDDGRRAIRSAAPGACRCGEALAHLPARELDAAERDALLHGRDDRGARRGGPVALPRRRPPRVHRRGRAAPSCARS